MAGVPVGARWVLRSGPGGQALPDAHGPLRQVATRSMPRAGLGMTAAFHRLQCGGLG